MSLSRNFTRLQFCKTTPRIENEGMPQGFNFSVNNAFSLLEVMIAMALFFMAVFSILALVANGLRNANALLEFPVDAGLLAAELAETNRLEEGFDSGDFGEIFPNYKWVRQITEVGTNGLYQVDFAVIQYVRGKPVESRMSILLYRPRTAQAGFVPRR